MKVYALVSPSGKRYIGITRTSMQKRWDAHLRQANKGKRHPLYDAMRKYGAEAFRIDILADNVAEGDAKRLEIYAIDLHDTTNRAYGYNLSAGGDYDAEAGAVAMRERLKDSAFRDQWVERIREAWFAKPRDISKQLAAAAQWRKDNPRRSYETARRNIRVAVKSTGREWTGGPGVVLGTFGRLWIPSDKVAAARHAWYFRQQAKAQWARRSEEERRDVGRKIAAGVSEHNRRPEVRAELVAHLDRARDKIDRSKQGPAASRGLKAYWARVKADPVAYAALMEAKKVKLRVKAREQWDRMSPDQQAEKTEFLRSLAHAKRRANV
jgi:group I intron endonuclease